MSPRPCYSLLVFSRHQSGAGRPGWPTRTPAKLCFRMHAPIPFGYAEEIPSRRVPLFKLPRIMATCQLEQSATMPSDVRPALSSAIGPSIYMLTASCRTSTAYADMATARESLAGNESAVQDTGLQAFRKLFQTLPAGHAVGDCDTAHNRLSPQGPVWPLVVALRVARRSLASIQP